MKQEAWLVTHPCICCSSFLASSSVLIPAYLDFTLKETASHSFCFSSVLCSGEPSANQILGTLHRDFPGGLDGKASCLQCGRLGSIPGSGRSSGEGNGDPLQYSCLENPMDRGAWWATVHRVSKSRT